MTVHEGDFARAKKETTSHDLELPALRGVSGETSGDTTPCRMTRVTLHGVVSPECERCWRGVDGWCCASHGVHGFEDWGLGGSAPAGCELPRLQSHRVKGSGSQGLGFRG